MMEIKIPVKKKRRKKRSAQGPRPSDSKADDGVAFLETFTNLLDCLSHSIPLMEKIKTNPQKEINLG
jgi:hypothetical protein